MGRGPEQQQAGEPFQLVAFQLWRGATRFRAAVQAPRSRYHETHRCTDCLQTPKERAITAVDWPRFQRATAANRRASNFFASRRL